MLAALLSSASLQEEKQGLQKDALSDGSSTKSTLYQDEWETIPINKFWIKKKKTNLGEDCLRGGGSSEDPWNLETADTKCLERTMG